MALKNATDFKAAITLAATAYQEAIGDDTLTGVALPLSNPKHPLRQLKRLIDLGDDGTFTSDDVYIAGAYAGEFPSKGSQDLNKKVNAPVAPEGIARLWNTAAIDAFTPMPQNEVAADVAAQTGIAEFNFSTLDSEANDQTAELLALNGTDYKITEVGNPSNFVQITAADGSFSDFGTADSIALSNLVDVWAWTVEIPADDAPILIG